MSSFFRTPLSATDARRATPFSKDAALDIIIPTASNQIETYFFEHLKINILLLWFCFDASERKSQADFPLRQVEQNLQYRCHRDTRANSG
jgi:hypothetical protein